MIDINLELWRPCYPTLVNSPTNPFPAPEKINAAASALLEDAWVLQCCLRAAHGSGLLLGEANADDCLDIGWGDMTPLVGGACAGWRWLMTIETQNCACN